MVEPINLFEHKKKQEGGNTPPTVTTSRDFPKYRVYVRQDLTLKPGFDAEFYEVEGNLGIGAFVAISRGEKDVEFLMPSEFLLYIHRIDDFELVSEELDDKEED